MSDIASDEAKAATKGTRNASLRMIIIAALGALVLGGGGFFAVYQGWILADTSHPDSPKSMPADYAFVAIDSMTISLVPGSGATTLQFAAQIEVPTRATAEVLRMHPRFLDIVNTYLRAVDPADLKEADALFRLRAQLLRRLQTIAGPDKIHDLLITEFVLR